jgi:hypothetical protein
MEKPGRMRRRTVQTSNQEVGLRAFLYILRASPDPDFVERSVPYTIDEGEIFFGPCKRNLRRALRQEYLSAERESAEPAEGLYLVGFNAAKGGVRKIVWMGRIKKVMTFAAAWGELSGPRYAPMRGLPRSPLHVRPIWEEEKLVGYQHVSKLHDSDWPLDLIDSKDSPDVRIDGAVIRALPGVDASIAFPRDACFLLENLFSAAGAGIDVDEELVSLLQQAQPEAKIDPLAVFGYQQDGGLNGKRGWWLPLSGDLASRFVASLQGRAAALRSKQGALGTLPSPEKCSGESTVQ